MLLFDLMSISLSPTGALMEMSTASSVGCRACFRVSTAPASPPQRLPCGGVYCAACLAQLSRSCLQVPMLLPLRCCHQAIPVDMVAPLLRPQEIAYYAMVVKDEVVKKRQRVELEREALVTRCDFCAAPTPLAVTQEAQSQLLDCGHVYCPSCLAALRLSMKNDVLCCRALVPGGGLAEPEAEAQQTPKANGKGKRKISPMEIVDLTFEDDSDDGGIITRPTAQAKQERCSTCQTPMSAATNMFRAGCGHVFCFACLQQRCMRAVRNEEQGSIGIPVQCCRKNVSLEVLRPVLSKRNFAKYRALVVKRGDAVVADLQRVMQQNKRAMAKEAHQQAAAQKAQEEARPVKKSRTSTKEAENTSATSVASAAQPKVADDGATVDCEACMTTIDQTANCLRGPCKHVYCPTCLALMARQTLENRALVPVRCCGEEFPIEYVERVLGKNYFTQYQRFLAEKDWRTSNLKSDKAYAEMVKKVNGKQCPKCGVGVQRIDGCLAMQCPRGHYFCWHCGQYPCTCGQGVPALRAHGH